MCFFSGGEGGGCVATNRILVELCVDTSKFSGFVFVRLCSWYVTFGERCKFMQRKRCPQRIRNTLLNTFRSRGSRKRKSSIPNNRPQMHVMKLSRLFSLHHWALTSLTSQSFSSSASAMIMSSILHISVLGFLYLSLSLLFPLAKIIWLSSVACDLIWCSSSSSQSTYSIQHNDSAEAKQKKRTNQLIKFHRLHQTTVAI